MVGIDLLADGSGILAMDMHQLTFPDQSFDAVFSCHSLEHAYDVSFFRYVVMDETADCYEDNAPWKSLKNNALLSYEASDIGISTFQTP